MSQQGDFKNALVHHRLDLGQHIAGTAVLFLTTQARNDAKCAGVVAPDADRHPRGIHRLTTSRQGRGKYFQRLVDLDLGFFHRAGSLKQDREGPHVVGTKDHVDPRSLFDDLALILLRQAATDGNLHIRVSLLGRYELT